MDKKSCTIGIDEVGRGPLAGPVTICAFLVYQKYWKQFTNMCKKNGVTDSKKLSPKKREALATMLNTLCVHGWCTYVCMSTSAQKIDTHGITQVIQTMISQSLKKMQITPTTTQIVLDGTLRAPSVFIHQKTIIKGDSKHMAIAAASIMAKVTRDRYMIRQGKRYPKYGFDVHKGYGTRAHQNAIMQYGFCPLHRRTFCRALSAKIDIA